MFKHYALFLAVFELGRVVVVLFMQMLAFIFDSAEYLWVYDIYTGGQQFKGSPTTHWLNTSPGGTGLGNTLQDTMIFKESMAIGNRQQGAGKYLRFIKSWDYKLEMLNISLQAIAYPLLHFGVENSW